MVREIDDKEYIECLSRVYRRIYFKWRERMLVEVDYILHDLETSSIEEVMEARHLTPRDVALLVRLKYIDKAAADKFDLWRIERSVP